jgi:hypothetical protein
MGRNWGTTGGFPFFVTGNWGTFRLSPISPRPPFPPDFPAIDENDRRQSLTILANRNTLKAEPTELV